MKKDYIGFIYLWINKLTGKKYIGLHFGNIYDGYTGSGKYFKKAFNKYGLENFERKILYYEYDSEENLYQKEFDMINALNAVFSSDFYNLTNYDPKGTKFIKGKKTRIVSEETKEKMRKLKLGTKLSEETKKKMSLVRKGSPSPTKGMIGLTSGSKNGQYGKKWYNNGITDMTFIPGKELKGWKLGRIRGINRGEKMVFMGNIIH